MSAEDNSLKIIAAEADMVRAFKLLERLDMGDGWIRNWDGDLSDSIGARLVNGFVYRLKTETEGYLILGVDVKGKRRAAVILCTNNGSITWNQEDSDGLLELTEGLRVEGEEVVISDGKTDLWVNQQEKTFRVEDHIME